MYKSIADEKKLGRPPRITREEILEVANSLLEEGENRLSIRNIANLLGVNQKAIYNRFKNKDELLNELAGVALREFWVDCDTSGPWRAALENWLHHARTILLNSPQLLHLIQIVAASPIMLGSLQKLAKLLCQAGLQELDAARQAQSLLWSVLGFTFFQMQASDPVIMRRYKNHAVHSPYGDFARHMAVENFDALWDATVARNLDGIEALGTAKL